MRGEHRSALRGLLTGVVLGGLLACSGPGPSAPEGGPATTLPVPPAAGTATVVRDESLRPFYEQVLEWVPCGEDVECGDLTVPVDWDAPDGETLEVALARRTATGERAGALVVNPGGPGASGVDLVVQRAEHVASPAVRAHLDVVGFDPRGVGVSDPVDCLDDREMDRFLARSPDPGEPAGLAAARAAAEAFAEGCDADAGALLANVDTVSVARDLDVLRAALGEERLHYLGRSYGTLLGATYADLFPGRVGRMVLDGGLDPALSHAEVALGQAEGLEQALRAYVGHCAERVDCPLRGSSAEKVAQVRSVLAAARERPLPTGDEARPLTASLAFYGLVAPLYDDESWPALDAAMEAALAGDGSVLLRLADAYAGRNADGTYRSNLLEVFAAVNCLDYPVEAGLEEMTATARRLREVSPTFGDALAYGELMCSDWPAAPVRQPGPVSPDGAPPVLVVGTTGDPATPYPWSVALAEQLDAALLTWEGEGHTAYGRGSRCVDDAVDRYLLDGVLPGEGATCG